MSEMAIELFIVAVHYPDHTIGHTKSVFVIIVEGEVFDLNIPAGEVFVIEKGFPGFRLGPGF